MSFTDDVNRPKTVPDREVLSTTVFRRNFLLDQNLYIIEALYDNQDPTNAAFIKTGETDDDNARVEVPPNSLGRIRDEIISFIEVTPDPVTGKGILTLKLATPQELRAKGFLS